MPQRIAERLQSLEDREAIRDLIARYGPLADAGDAEAVAAQWSEDGSYAVGRMGCGTGIGEPLGIGPHPRRRQVSRREIALLDDSAAARALFN